MALTKKSKKRKKDRIKFIIDRALIALMDNDVREFTSLDVESKELELGYKYYPSKNHVARRLAVHSRRGFVELAKRRENGLPQVWRFTNKSGGIRRLYNKRRERMLRERNDSMNNTFVS